MTYTVHCKKLKNPLPGMDEPPIPGALGEKIFHEISHDAWQMWLSHQTMLINEYRLNMMDKSARDFLFNEMEKFLFSDEAKKPPGYTHRA